MIFCASSSPFPRSLSPLPTGSLALWRLVDQRWGRNFLRHIVIAHLKDPTNPSYCKSRIIMVDVVCVGMTDSEPYCSTSVSGREGGAYQGKLSKFIHLTSESRFPPPPSPQEKDRKNKWNFIKDR